MHGRMGEMKHVDSVVGWGQMLLGNVLPASGSTTELIEQLCDCVILKNDIVN